MKNLKSFLSFILIAISFQFVNAQELAMIDVSKKYIPSSNSAAEELKIDRTGITELSDFLMKHVAFPVEELGYSNQVSVTMQISVNELGEIIDVRQVKGQNRIGKSVISALASLKSVSPILVNGIPTSKTIHLPLIFKQ